MKKRYAIINISEIGNLHQNIIELFDTIEEAEFFLNEKAKRLSRKYAGDYTIIPFYTIEYPNK